MFLRNQSYLTNEDITSLIPIPTPTAMRDSYPPSTQPNSVAINQDFEAAMGVIVDWMTHKTFRDLNSLSNRLILSYSKDMSESFNFDIDYLSGSLKIIPRSAQKNDTLFDFLSRQNFASLYKITTNDLIDPAVFFELSFHADIQRFEKTISELMAAQTITLAKIVDQDHLPLTLFQKFLLFKLGCAIVFNTHDVVISSPYVNFPSPWLNRNNQICMIVPVNGSQQELVGLNAIYDYTKLNSINIHPNFWVLLHQFSRLELPKYKNIFSLVKEAAHAQEGSSVLKLTELELMLYKSLLCPLSNEIMQIPVSVTTEGEGETFISHTYDKNHLDCYISSVCDSPSDDEADLIDPMTQRIAITLPSRNGIYWDYYCTNQSINMVLQQFLEHFVKTRNYQRDGDFVLIPQPLEPRTQSIPEFLTQNAEGVFAFKKATRTLMDSDEWNLNLGDEGVVTPTSPNTNHYISSLWSVSGGEKRNRDNSQDFQNGMPYNNARIKLI